MKMRQQELFEIINVTEDESALIFGVIGALRLFGLSGSKLLLSGLNDALKFLDIKLVYIQNRKIKNY